MMSVIPGNETYLNEYAQLHLYNNLNDVHMIIVLIFI
jgi:hypothetical protein